MSPWAPIEGETPIDPSDIKDRSIKTRSQLNEAEAENVRKATVKYLAARPSERLAPFDYGWFCKLHGEMFGDVFLSAGEPRTRNLNLGVPWELVPNRMMELAQDLAGWDGYKTYDLTEQAARLHYQAVHIHPFCNGNGRWARLLANIWLRRHSASIIRWPEVLIGKESPIRKKYISHLKAADDGDFGPLLELHRRYVS
jgi:Fic-DOC domain mobile mystery protein B